MTPLVLNREGFITDYLVSGPRESDFTDSTVDPNQLHYEKYLRSIVSEKRVDCPDGRIILGQPGRNGSPWRYYYGQGNWFVDCSAFYSSLKKVDLDAAVVLHADESRDTHAVLWTYAAVTVWCNGRFVCENDTPVYKPITRTEMVLPLRRGENDLYVMFQNLGVRDTRNLFGIQILGDRKGLNVSLPDMDRAKEFVERAQWLSALKLRGRAVVFPSPAPSGTMIGTDSLSPDFADSRMRVSFRDVSGMDGFVAEPGNPNLVAVCDHDGERLSRNLEIPGEAVPHYASMDSSTAVSIEENAKRVYAVIAGVQSLNRGGKYGFALPNILARKAVHLERADDRDSLLNNLSLIERRYDCTDFLVSGLIRYIHNYGLDDELERRTEDVLLNYRYWMTHKGSDAMCFWSENHSLLFYSNAMFVGQLYPDKFFPRAGMTGRELYAFGRDLTDQWLSDVESCGFEEFLSTVYMCVTFAGLLNVIDYADPELSGRTKKLTDRLLEMLSLHTFKGVVIAPMGRVYRDIIYPFRQGAQALINLVNPEVPDSYGEGWVSWYATSSYRFPDGLTALMDAPVSTEYATGNALVRLEKKADYCVTSVQSPREDSLFRRWENLTLRADDGDGSHAYTKSLNERFHGTTCFEPGVYGYQQHMWSAALDAEVHVFTNHPGGTVDSSSMRPGYWYGNGVMPAIKQAENRIGMIYVIPDSHPIHFTHLFWPSVKFDETLESGRWLLGRKGAGFIGVWCSTELEPFDDQLARCEFRAYGDVIAWACVCGSASEDGSFELFCRRCTSSTPSFSVATRVLEVPEWGYALEFRAREDTTQYI